MTVYHGAEAARAMSEQAVEILKLSARVRELEQENFALAAGQCKAFYGDDGGSPRCRFQDTAAAAHVIATQARFVLDAVSRMLEQSVTGPQQTANLVREMQDLHDAIVRMERGQ